MSDRVQRILERTMPILVKEIEDEIRGEIRQELAADLNVVTTGVAIQDVAVAHIQPDGIYAAGEGTENDAKLSVDDLVAELNHLAFRLKAALGGPADTTQPVGNSSPQSDAPAVDSAPQDVSDQPGADTPTAAPGTDDNPSTGEQTAPAPGDAGNVESATATPDAAPIEGSTPAGDNDGDL